MTNLTADTDSLAFISRYGCNGYKKHSQTLMISERKRALDEELNTIEKLLEEDLV